MIVNLSCPINMTPTGKRHYLAILVNELKQLGFKGTPTGKQLYVVVDTEKQTIVDSDINGDGLMFMLQPVDINAVKNAVIIQQHLQAESPPDQLTMHLRFVDERYLIGVMLMASIIKYKHDTNSVILAKCDNGAQMTVTLDTST